MTAEVPAKPILASVLDHTIQTEPEPEFNSQSPVVESVPLQSDNLHSPRRKQKNGKQLSKARAPLEARLLVGREEAAEILSISVRGVDYLIAAKRLSTRRIGARVLIPIEDVRRFARADHPERMAG